jgi:hypothetical protein
MFCCRKTHSIKRRILSYCYPKEPVLYQSTYGDISILASVSIDERIRKYKIWKDGIDVLSVDEIESILHHSVRAPWLWIGCTTIFGETDMTSTLDQYLVSGNHITPEILSRQYPYHWDWKYLDPVTFKEVDFPNEGITIDAPRVERITKESQEVESTE